MKRIRKQLAVIMVLMIACAVFAPLTMQPSEAAAKYDLPSRVTNYDYKKGKWVKKSYSKLKYTNSGYLRTVTHSDGTRMSLKYSFYKNGKLKMITCPGGETLRFNTKGLMTRYCLSSGGTFIKYSYKGSMVSKYWDRDGDVAKYKYTKYPDGSIKEMILRYPSTTAEDDPDFVTTFDENGLLLKEMEGFPPNNFEVSYKYTFDKKGRVKSVIATSRYDNKNQWRTKHVYSYTKAQKTKNKSRITALINTHAGTLNYGQTVASGGGYMDAIRFILPMG